MPLFIPPQFRSLYGPGASTGDLVQTKAPVPGVTVDNGVYLPNSNAEWQALGLSPWGGWWGMQEATGSELVASGSAGFTLAARKASTLLFQYQEDGWNRRGLRIGSEQLENGWSAATGVGFNLQNQSVAMLGYLRVSQLGAAVRNVMGAGSAVGGTWIQMWTAHCASSGVPRLVASGSAQNGTIVMNDGRYHPWLLVKDGTNSRVKLYTDMEAVTGSYPATAWYDGFKGYGGLIGSTIATCSSSCVYMAYCTGSVAAALSDNGRASNFLRTLGWTPNW